MIIENTQGITQIIYKAKTKNYCPIGRDWYTSNIQAQIEPDNIIPDYIDLDKFVAEQINQKEMIIEDVVNTLYNHISAKYKPKSLTITIKVDDAAHSEVVVSKAGANE